MRSVAKWLCWVPLSELAEASPDQTTTLVVTAVDNDDLEIPFTATVQCASSPPTETRAGPPEWSVLVSKAQSDSCLISVVSTNGIFGGEVTIAPTPQVERLEVRVQTRLLEIRESDDDLQGYHRRLRAAGAMRPTREKIQFGLLVTTAFPPRWARITTTFVARNERTIERRRTTRGLLIYGWNRDVRVPLVNSGRRLRHQPEQMEQLWEMLGRADFFASDTNPLAYSTCIYLDAAVLGWIRAADGLQSHIVLRTCGDTYFEDIELVQSWRLVNARQGQQ